MNNAFRKIKAQIRKPGIFCRSIYNQFLIEKHFPKGKMKPFVDYNRESLTKIKKWIDDDVYNNSVFHYGLPPEVKHLIDRESDRNITYSDVLLYLSSFLEKRVNYLELGVSVGKNYYQMMNYFKNSTLTGFDIERINPVIEGFLERIDHETWSSIKSSPKKDKSSLAKYIYPINFSQINYISADIFDETAWGKIAGAKYNIIFSDALHSPDALLYEYEMINKYGLLDEDEFILMWDDLHGEMETAFMTIWSDLSRRCKLDKKNKIRVLLNGWIGRKVHEIGIITKFNPKQSAVQHDVFAAKKLV